MSIISIYNGYEWVEIGKNGYSPVLGVDYWTEDDQKTILNKIKKSLPVIKDGKDGSPDTPEQVVEKVNKSKNKIKSSQVEGLTESFNNLSKSVTMGGVQAPILDVYNAGTLVKTRVTKINFSSGATVASDTVNVAVGGGSSSPLTTKGDVYVYSTTNDRLPVGTDGQVLSSDSTQATGLKWIALAGGGDMVLAASQIVTGLKTFLDGTIGLRNVANTFTGLFTNTITAARTWTWPDKSGTVAMTSDVVITTQDEGGTLSSTVNTINFVGAGVTASGAGATTTVTIPGGGTVPTGTGFTHITAGAQDGAAKLVDTTDINNSQVTLAKIANIGTDTILGRATAASGVVEELTALPFAFTGDVTRPIDSNVQTIANSAVTLAKQADVATSTVFYRKTAGSGAPEVNTLATLKTDLGLTGTNSGDQTTIVGITGTLAQFNTAITDADIVPTSTTISTTAPLSGGGDLSANRTITTSMNTNKLIGRGTAAVGVMEEITLGTNLSFSGTTLNAASGGSSPLTTKGDLYTFDTVNQRLPVGSNNQVLVADSTQATGLKWATNSGAGITRTVTNISTNTTASSTAATDYVYNVNGNVTLTMPTAVGNTNRYTIRNAGIGIVNIVFNGNELCNGQNIISITPASTTINNTSLDLISDGTNWGLY